MKALLRRILDPLQLVPKQKLERTRLHLKRAQQNNRRIQRRNQNLKQKLKEARQQFKQLARENLLSRMPKHSVCAEIGVHEGKFSKEILRIVQPERLHLIDPWQHEEGDPDKASQFGGLKSDVGLSEGQAIMDERHRKIRQVFDEEITARQVQIYRSCSDVASKEFKDSYFDWIYIDGNHLYEFVKQDLELYYPKVKPGGCIVGDDYGMVMFWDNGVQRAVDEFVAREFELTLEVAEGHQFVIRKQV